MFDLIKTNYFQVRETLKGSHWKDLIRKRVFWRRVMTPVEMDLTALAPSGDLLKDPSYRLIELKLEEIRTGVWSFAVPSRGFKAVHNLKSGLRGFAVVKDTTVLGDVWCSAPHDGSRRANHADLKMLSVRCLEHEAYAFDMLIDPTFRGKNLAAPLQRFLQQTLKAEGWRKVYGFYWDDNLPALWMHRMLKFHELPKRRVSRFFFLVSAGSVSQTGAASQSMKENPSKQSMQEKP
ncbi:MAG: GNAT family N-acetyltransferase [Omnitrophica WOR_2 bacterium]